ncbi:MAG: Uma2 family endonuclease [Chloroflexota bacterium]|nr:Uma2 family endonuclease [Chloroflexota bacterium]
MVVQPSGKNIVKLQAEYDDPTIEYPYEDDELLAETEYQYEPLTYAVAALKAHFSSRDDVYAQGDMFVYYRMNDPRSVVAPDVFVVIGALGNHKRNSWFTWREGDRQPNFVLEIASESTWRWDASGKRDIYARIGVDEYWRFDPTGECFSPPLIGERLVNGEYRPIDVTDDDGILRGRSDVLSLDICVRDELELRLYDPVRGEWLMYYQEAQDALQAKGEALQTERQALQAERAAREAAESRIRELEAQLTRQQNNDSS